MSPAMCAALTCAHALRPPPLHDRRVCAVHLGQDLNGAQHLDRIGLCHVELPHQFDEAQARFKRQRRGTAGSSKQCQVHQLAIKLREARLQQSRHQRRHVSLYKADPLRIGARSRVAAEGYSQEVRGFLRAAPRAPGSTAAASTLAGRRGDAARPPTGLQRKDIRAQSDLPWLAVARSRARFRQPAYQRLPDRRAARATTALQLDEAIDACLLRLLDQRVRSALASHHCDTLGPLNASIAGAIGPTWTAWHASLKADKALLSAFLRWLANVEQDERSPWNGDHASIPHLATALVMMLATHHGEPLEPAFADRGNLKFSHNAVALGSGCQMVGQQPIAIWDQPDQWGVDALILSGSAEVEVVDPPGRVLDGGKLAMGMAAARRVRPVVINAHIMLCVTATESQAHWRGIIDLGEKDETVCRKVIWMPDTDALDASYDQFLARTFLAQPWRSLEAVLNAPLDHNQGLAERILGRHGLSEPTAKRWVVLAETYKDDPDGLIPQLVAAREQSE